MESKGYFKVSDGDCETNMVMVYDGRCLPVYFIKETEKAILWNGPGGASFWLPKRAHLFDKENPFVFYRASFPSISEPDLKGELKADYKYFTDQIPGARSYVI